MDDIMITDMLNSRDQKGLSELKSKYSRLILKICRSILQSEEDAEECANDTLLDIWNSLDTNRPENLRAYVCRIARRRAVDRLRYNKAAARDSALLTELDECLSSQCTVEGEVEMAELSKALNDWLLSLPEKQQRLFTLRYFYLYSIKDSAKQCSMSQTAVTTALSRLRGALKSYLIERGMYYD